MSERASVSRFDTPSILAPELQWQPRGKRRVSPGFTHHRLSNAVLHEDELLERAAAIRASLKTKTKAKAVCTSAHKTYSRGVDSASAAIDKLEVKPTL